MAPAAVSARQLLLRPPLRHRPLFDPSCRISPAIPLRPTSPRATGRRAAYARIRNLSSSPAAFSPPPSSSKFSYGVAASYIGKDRPFDPSTHVFHFNPYNNRVHRPGDKASRPDSGQDAFFVSRVGPAGSGGGVALGVADGVGGWMDSGIDPADFSHGLCGYAAAEASGYGGSRNKTLTARGVMQRGYDAVCRDPAIWAGGSTAVVGLLGDGGEAEVANLGDSGYILLRQNGVHAHSEAQVHAFNTPFQLSAVPPGLALQTALFGGAQLSDQPRDADLTRLALRHGDVLVFASDGLWDNLFNQDILRIVSRTMTRTGAWIATGSGIEPVPDLGPLTGLVQADPPTQEAEAPATLQSLLATALVGAAKAASVNTKEDGPFAKEVKRFYPLDNWRGGKVDDICVIAVVVSESGAQARL